MYNEAFTEGPGSEGVIDEKSSGNARTDVVVHVPSLGPGQAAAADPRFDKIVDDYFAARFDYRPSEGTAAGCTNMITGWKICRKSVQRVESMS